MVLVRKIIIGGYLFNRGIPPSRQIFYLHKSFQQITKMFQLSSLRESDQVLLSVVSVPTSFSDHRIAFIYLLWYRDPLRFCKIEVFTIKTQYH